MTPPRDTAVAHLSDEQLLLQIQTQEQALTELDDPEYGVPLFRLLIRLQHERLARLEQVIHQARRTVTVLQRELFYTQTHPTVQHHVDILQRTLARPIVREEAP